MTSLVLLILLSLPPYHLDKETDEQRVERLTTIATAIDSASLRAVCGGRWQDGGECEPIWKRSQEDLALLLVTKGFFESRFARHVHAGKCRPHECDHGRSASPWQLEHGNPWRPRKVWEATKGLDLTATTNAAWEASKTLSIGLRACGTIHGAISMYATGHTCKWSGAKRRESFFWLLKYRAKKFEKIKGEK